MKVTNGGIVYIKSNLALKALAVAKKSWFCNSIGVKEFTFQSFGFKRFTPVRVYQLTKIVRHREHLNT